MDATVMTPPAWRCLGNFAMKTCLGFICEVRKKGRALPSVRALPVVVLILTMAGWCVAGAANTTPTHPPPDGRQVTLRKCIDASGAIAFQSEPCHAGDREAWSKLEALDARREAGLTAHASSHTSSRESVKGSARVPRLAAGRAANSNPARNRCDAARAHAARKRDRQWNRLGFDALSRLDAWVADRCR